MNLHLEVLGSNQRSSSWLSGGRSHAKTQPPWGRSTLTWMAQEPLSNAHQHIRPSNFASTTPHTSTTTTANRNRPCQDRHCYWRKPSGLSYLRYFLLTSTTSTVPWPACHFDSLETCAQAGDAAGTTPPPTWNHAWVGRKDVTQALISQPSLIRPFFVP